MSIPTRCWAAPTLHLGTRLLRTDAAARGFLGPFLDPFNNACTEIVVDRSNAPNLESSRAVQVAPLIFSSFPARNKDQHIDIQKLGRCTSHVAQRWKERIDTNHPTISLHAPASVLEELDALLILPVMNDMFHDVDVGGWYRVEHVSSDIFQSVGNCTVLHRKALLGDRNEVGNVHHGSLQRGVLLQQGNRQVAEAATDVSNLRNAFEVAVLQHAAQ